jgi:hypothetical protein
MKKFKKYLKESQELQSKVGHFVDFATDTLGIKRKPTIKLLMVREPEMTTANYNLADGVMKIYVKNRALCDICRSIAHEMVHQKQHEEVDDPSQLDGSTGSPHEDQANAYAGRLIRMYGTQYPEFYE